MEHLKNNTRARQYCRNPTPEPVEGATWTRFNSEKTNYLSISLPELSMKDNYYAEEVAFWNGLVPALEEQAEKEVCSVAKKFPGMPFLLYYATYC